MAKKILGPTQTFLVFLYCGILIMIISGLLLTQDFEDPGDSIYSWDEIGSDSIVSHPLVFDDGIDRIDLRIDVLSVEQIDVYLVESRVQEPDSISEVRVIRSGIFTHDFNEAYGLHWSVDTEEFGNDNLLLVVENTNEGRIPAINETIEVCTRCQSTVYQKPTSLPPTYGLVIVASIYIVLVVGYFRKSKETSGHNNG